MTKTKINKQKVYLPSKRVIYKDKDGKLYVKIGGTYHQLEYAKGKSAWITKYR